MTRRKGEGSIYQRADGQFCGSITLPPGADGKRRRRVLYGKTAREVLAKLGDLRAEMRLGRVPATRRPRVTVAMLLDDWLTAIAKPTAGLRPLTRHQYGVEARTRVRPFLGDLDIGDLTDDVLRRWQDALLDRYAPRSVLKARIPLAGVILLARRRKLLMANPLELVPPPTAKRPRKRAISGEEAGRFLRAIAGHPLETLFLADLLLGARRGELLGLTWADVDLAASTVTIRHQLQQVPAEGLRLVEPKSEAGIRVLPLPSFLVERLRDMHARTGMAGEAPVFTNTRGRPLAPDRYNQAFKSMVEDADLAPLTPHELRHSVATVLVALGVPPPVVAQYLGHADASVSLRWYTHAVPEALREAANRMDEYVRRLDQEHNSNGYNAQLQRPPETADLSS